MGKRITGGSNSEGEVKQLSVWFLICALGPKIGGAVFGVARERIMGGGGRE